MALGNALARLRPSKAKSRVIVLVTDGGNNAGEIDPDTAAGIAKALGVRVFGLGSALRAKGIESYGRLARQRKKLR